MSATAPISIPLTKTPFTGTSSGNGFSVKINISCTPGAPSVLWECLVDTGSCGIVVPQCLFYENQDVNGALLPGVTMGGAAVVPYEPSSEDLNGYYYYVEQLGIGADEDGNCAYVCQNATVVGVYNNKNPKEGMMGVGFGRPTQIGTNVFLHAGVNPSYLFTTDGIWLGYTAETLPQAASYGFQQLTALGPSADAVAIPDPLTAWSTPAVQFQLVNGIIPTTYTGSVLVDTGVNLMMIGFDSPTWQRTFANSTLTITWPALQNNTTMLTEVLQVGAPEQVTIGGKSTLAYAVTSQTKMAPMYILPLGQKSPSFANAGINVIQGANYFFDGGVGQVGFMPLSS